MAYPLSSMGAHVSAVPNHQTGRTTPIDAGGGRVLRGVRLRARPDRAYPDDERTRSAAQIAFYTSHREMFQRGRFVRLRSPFEARERDGLDGIAPDGSRAVVGYYQVLIRPVPHGTGSVCAGWTRMPGTRSRPGLVRPALGTFDRGGDELMRVGLGIEPPDPLPLDAPPPDGPDRSRRLHVPYVRRAQDLRRQPRLPGPGASGQAACSSRRLDLEHPRGQPGACRVVAHDRLPQSSARHPGGPG